MGRVQVTLNSAELERALKSPEIRADVDALAARLAAEVGEDAEVTGYTTDRAGASVRVPAWRQARDGALTRAAGALGLTIYTE